MPFINVRVEKKNGNIIEKRGIWIEDVDNILTGLELAHGIPRSSIEDWDSELVEESEEYK
jgi:hypothetical protein